MCGNRSYDKKESDVIRYVYQQFVVEHRPLRAIAREIGKPMQTVRLYLQNSIYRGILRYDKKRGAKYPARGGKQPDRKKVPRPAHEIIEVQVFGGAGQVPQLVGDTMWALAQARLKENSRTSTRRREQGRPEAWASGFLVSALAPLVGTPRGDGFLDLTLDAPQHHQVYANGGHPGMRRYACRCGRKHSKVPRCGFRNPRSEPANITLDAYLAELTSEDWFVQAVRASLGSSENLTGIRRDTIEKRLVDLERREARLRRLYLEGRIDPEHHDKEQDSIRTEREMLRGELVSLDAEDALPSDEDLEGLQSKWTWNPAWDHKQKRAWLERYIHEIALSNDGVEWAVVRVPAGHDSMPVFGTGHRMPWVVPVMSRRRPRRKT